MGFYGNISNSNKSSFTFDRVYSTRKEMDAACDTDGIFLGRFVLVEYDINPIKGYCQDSAFYTDKQCKNLMIAVEGNYYQNLFETENNIYHYQSGVFTKITAENYDYGAHYKIDVETYGRGYDSTAWMKRYDAENNSFKYVMIAELNTVIPDFHLIVDPPEDEKEVPNIPYFDEYSTNLNYYLHMPANFTHEIKKENITFNKDGFDKDKRSYIENPTNSIGYDKIQGTRGYLSHVYDTDAETAKDTYKWHITLEGIGNMVCQFWDLMYGEARNQIVATSKDDNGNRDANSVLGALNLIRDLIGYAILPYDSVSQPVLNIEDNEPILRKIYYKDQNNKREYYYFVLKEGTNEYYLQRLPNASHENSIYGLLEYLCTLLGLNNPQSLDTKTVLGCINKMNEWFKLGGDRLDGGKFMVTADDGKMTTFGGLGDIIYQPNSEELFLRGGVWVDLEDIKVTDPFDQKVLPLATVLNNLNNRISGGAGIYMKELDILDDLTASELPYNWMVTKGEVVVNAPDGQESSFTTVRDVDYSIYLAEQKMEALYDMLLYDIIYHFNLEMKEPEYTVTKNETDDTIEILTLTNNYQNENGHSECSCLLTGKLADGKSITIDLVIPDNGILNVHKSHYNFDSIEKIEIKRVHKFRSSDTTLQPIVKIISVEA